MEGIYIFQDTVTDIFKNLKLDLTSVYIIYVIGMIPLHFAVNHKKADIDTVQFLLEKYKAGAEVRLGLSNPSLMNK